MKSLLVIIVFLLSAFVCGAQKVPDTTGSSVSRDEAQQALDLHNKYRADVGTPPLQWSPVLAAFAQDWADKLAANNCAFEHRQNNQYGENIFGGGGVRYTVIDATNSWYEEIKQFDSNNAQAGIMEAGHYTQVVWRTTTQVGMGVSTCANGNYIIVANYNPPGNMMGDRPY